MRKLTKDQRYNRKRRKDGNKDFRKVIHEDGTEGVRVTRKALSVSVSMNAYERLVELALKEGINRWEMLSRMLIYSLPAYASPVRSDSPTKRYDWSEHLMNHAQLPQGSIKYKGAKGDKQINYDITSTAWKKLHSHKAASGLSKARIVQSIILHYTPSSPAQRQRAKDLREQEKTQHQAWEDRMYEGKKLIDLGHGEFVHYKGIAIEYWDESELQEWEERYQKYQDSKPKS